MPCFAHGAVFLRDPLPPTCEIRGLCRCLWALCLVSRPGHYKACRPTWYPHTVSAVRPQNNPTDCCLPQCPHAALGLDSGVQRQGALSRAIVLAQVSEPHPASRSGLRGLYSPALLCSWGPPGQEEIFRGP